MARPVMCLRRIGVRAAITPLLISLVLGPRPLAVAAPSPTPATVPTDTYKVPEYTQAKLPSITSCSAKADGSMDDATVATGNNYLDSILSTAKTVNKAYGNRSDDDADDEGDIDGNATIDTDCDKLKVDGAADKLGLDSEKLQCAQVKDADFIEDMKNRHAASKKYLACKRGVLDALRGELGCFKKQIAEAESYMNEVVNGPGGLNEMLKNGNDEMLKVDAEVQDRQAQYQQAVERIEGGEGGNPPGLKQAKTALAELTKSLPKRVTQVNQAVENLRGQQASFETMVNQLTMARAMECMNTPTAGYRCVKEGTSSANHPEWNGNVSPFTYLKCLYAQSANKQARGGAVIKNASREKAYLDAAETAIKNASAKAPADTQLPNFSNKEEFEKRRKIYTVNSPTDLGKLLSTTLRDMEVATGKNMTSQFWASINTCYANAKKEIAKERTEANSDIKRNETVMKQQFETTRSDNASAFRELRDAYATAVKAATGQTVNIDTTRCETASLEDQAKCFEALNAMTDTLLTGKVTPTATALTGPAQSLTNGQDPIRGFSSTLTAKGNPARTIAVSCAGVDDCLTKYTNLRTALKQTVDERKQFKETFKGQINVKLRQTAMDLASKGLTGAGQAGIAAGGITLNQVAANIEARKNQLATALSRMGVKDGIDLDAKEIKEPSAGEGELYKPSDLKNLVLAAITPGLPDTNSKGFTKATDAISERDTEFEKLQDKLDTDFSTIQSKIAECEKESKKLAREAAEKACDKASAVLKDCIDATKGDQITKSAADIEAIMKASKDYLATFKTTEERNKALETLLGKKDSATLPLNCGQAPAEKEEKCKYYDELVENMVKDAGGTGSKSSLGRNSSAGN